MIRKFFLKVSWIVLRIMLSFRYRVEVRGKEALKDERFKNKGTLVLANHVSEMDPFMLIMLMGIDFEVKPLVTENFYNYPFAYPFMRLVGAKPVAQFDTAISDYKFKSAEKLFNNVVEDLTKGGHIMLYPSAALKITPEERIGGRSLAHATMQAAPDAEILLVRISGFWGSMFSKVYSEETPDFWKTFAKGALIVLKNLFFFTPKRHVTVEFSVVPENFPKKGSKMEFNRALEEFFNQYPDPKDPNHRLKKEPLYQVPYYFWSKKLPPIFERGQKKEGVKELPIPKYVRQDIMYQLSELSGKSVKEINDSDDLVHDLGLDSLNIAGLYTHIDNHYGLTPNLQPADLITVHDILAAAIHMKESKVGGEAPKEHKSHWKGDHKRRPEIECGAGETVIEVFLNSCDRMKGHSACADMTSGEMDYLTMKRAVVILAKKIQKMEGDYIGVMLPSSIAVHLIIQAIMLAGKIPVPLNWTVGRFFINHAIKLLEITTVISSGKFLQRLDNVDLGDVLEKLVLIEDIKASITLKEKITGALLAKRKAKSVLRAFPASKRKGEDVAVALFTSGTTALPKCVPLTHKNLLINQKDAMPLLDLRSDDVEIMVLPAFHIFGLSIGILPLIYGIRCVYSPDPLDASAIAKLIFKWRVTLILMTPTFYTHLFRVASLNQLQSIRIFVSGAEAAPPTLMEFISKLGDVAFVEGYGLTETSPIISANPIYAKPRGVGKIIPSVDLITIDHETLQKLNKCQVGEICVRGETVFKGYYKHDNKDVFVEIDGKKYFRTGDLGYCDEQGYLHLSGRLKLSFKKGGEMISLAAIEAAVLRKAKEKGWIAQDINHNPFACVPKEPSTGSPKVVLFSEVHLTLDQVNTALVESGFSRLYKVNEIVVIDAIPVLKTGKTCYRKLFEMVETSSTK